MNRARIKEIESIAFDLLRDTYGQDPIIPPIDIGRVIQTAGLNVRFGPFNDPNVDGAFVRRDRTIYIKESAPYVRQAFTAAHELGHFLLHEHKHEETFYRREAFAIGAENLEEEKEANCFAASLLMPREIMTRFWHAIGDVNEVAERFDVSSQAAFWRLKNLGLLEQFARQST